MGSSIEVSLDSLKAGDHGVIQSYRGANPVHARLKEMGLVRGTPVEVKRLAPLGDPMELRVRGYHLSLRKEDASCIVVTPKEGGAA